MTRRFLGLTSLSTLFALGLTGCPGDDAASGDTDTATTTPTSSTSTSTSTSTTTGESTSTTTTTTDPSTSTTTDPTTTGTETGLESSSSSTGDTGELPCPYTPVEDAPSVDIQVVATGFAQPLLVVGHPVDTDDLYVVQKGGQIRVLTGGATEAPAENWLEIAVDAGGEGGLLGFAFHPDYETDSRIYVAYSSPTEQGATAIAEFTVEGGAVNMASRREVFAVGQPQNNHNGGMIQFGPDGMLYASFGDGGPQNDVCEYGQDQDTHLGTLVRLDPNGDGNADQSTPACPDAGQCGCNGVGGLDYTTPGDNPFVGDDGLEEIYAYGFRNPWRFSFDPIDGTMWVADVGQSGWEEVTVVEAGDNAGWGDMEGLNCNNDPDCDDTAAPGTLNADGMRMPIIEYGLTGSRCSIIGLGNYRSCESPAFDGRYYYSDFCSGEVWSVGYDGTTVTEQGVVGQVPADPLGGGYNAYGDVFIASGNGTIYRIAPGA